MDHECHRQAHLAGVDCLSKATDLRRSAGGTGARLSATQSASDTPRDHLYIRAPVLLQAFPAAVRTKPKGGRHRWKDPYGLAYEWDSRHGAVEVYTARGTHLGEYDHVTCVQLKPADPTSKIEP